jgi:cellobiose phosphorylase
LFTIEQLVRHARMLGERHEAVVREGPNQLLVRLDRNEKRLRDYNRATLAADQTRRITPAAEWLLDNFYLIEEQILMARRHLPRSYSRELPQLVNGQSSGYPRVYDLVLELISHVDAQLDAERLSAFVGAYQAVTPLKLGELWAVPIMLRLALVENLRRITVRLTAARQDRDMADYWADKLQAVAETDPSNLIVVVGEMAKARLPVTSAFVTEFSQRLGHVTPAVHLVRTWLEQYLAEHGLGVEQLRQAESQNQAADQVTVSHSITSLRFFGAMDWREFVETMSAVDQTLRNDPAGVYGDMDFFTRDRYRHCIEKLSRHSSMSEHDIARKVVELAEAGAREKGRRHREAHVGHYLIDKGRQTLEQAVRARWPLSERIASTIRRFPTIFYVGGILSVTLATTAAACWRAAAMGIHGGELVFFAAVVFFCTSQFGVALLNWLTARLLRPRLLPRLDFSEGIPSDCRTMVVIPTVLTRSEAVLSLLETLEIHYLANRDANLHFALLTDFRDATQEEMPEDAALLEQAREGIEALSRKYAGDRRNVFFLFHRPRRWNPSEGMWMGYERKRGKLTEFNGLLRGHCFERFSEVIGDKTVLPAIKFVITLDSDTQLPRDAARQLVGTIAHPLNRPELHPDKGIVSEGYGILQPRVGVSLPSAGRSWFVRILAPDAGIDPYTRAVSDVYQDLFNEGSFIGKGIYDVDAFERAVRGRFPENTVLSHDLIESVHARSALVNDVELYEAHPSRYNADMSRRHRWIRGDWQIAPWLLPRVPGPDGYRVSNPLSGLSRWKILDNLRRSLIPGALMLLLITSWIVLPQLNVLAILVVLAVVIIPGLLSVATEAFCKAQGSTMAVHLRSVGNTLVHQLGQMGLTLVFLPYDAYMSLDAVFRTLLRMLITRKRLLEWQTASEAEDHARTDFAGFYATMWIAPAVAIVLLLFLSLQQPSQLPAAAPFLLVWLCAPGIGWWISLPIEPQTPEFSERQAAFLRRTARKTWRFFETFVTSEENWLPPDNFQEKPLRVVASRTSPTNIGLSLLANLAACDFGYLTVGQLIQRTQNTLGTLHRLVRHRGHLYNWYDTRTLEPLSPHYISTVDSGNLAGFALALSAGLTECADQPILGPQAFDGLRDTLAILREKDGDHPVLKELNERLARIPSGFREQFTLLKEIERLTGNAAADSSNRDDDFKWWCTALERTCSEHLAELALLAPWLSLQVGGAPPALDATILGLNTIPTLRQVAALTETVCSGLERVYGQSEVEDHSRSVLLQCLREASGQARARLQTLEELATRVNELAAIDFSFLYDSARNLFAIGYNLTDRQRDNSFYDLLASEARLASFIAIAQGKIPQEHWFSLGRLLAGSRGEPVLVSWSGSMFEYLMPILVMPGFDNTLLNESCKAAVKAQIEYGRSHGVPWGISESGFHSTDIHLNYQYRAFGVPGLGFKRGLADDLVIAPYATMMALMVAPGEACENLERLASEGQEGAYGFYEAVDYTPSRLPPDATSATVRSFMAHHQGMSLVSLAYVLLERPMQRRFLSNPVFKASELLLQERVPKVIATIRTDDLEMGESRQFGGGPGESLMRVFTNPNAPTPDVHLLSNGRYHVLISSAGGGYSRWQDLAVTRWREDSTRDCWGNFCYVRNVQSGEFWSVGYQPSLRRGARYEAIFTQARAEFRQHHDALELHAEICVSPEDDVELRRITLINQSNTARIVEFTSYAEVVLAQPAADASHPAFGNLFAQTEFLRSHPAILCTRRARGGGEHPPWLFHLMSAQGVEQTEVSFETDRGKFIGRCRNLTLPAAMQGSGSLSNTEGPVLDPIVSLRRTVRLAPDEIAVIEMVTGIAGNRNAAAALVEKYYSRLMTDRLIDLAWTHSQVTLRHLDATEADAQLYGRLTGSLVYLNPTGRAASSILRNNRRGQSGLWSYGISGDVPIVLLRIGDVSKIEIARRLIQAHAYWRLKGLTVELVILNEDASVYRQTLHDQIVGLIASGIGASMLEKPGGIFVRRLEQIPAEDRILLQAAARVVFSDEAGTLEQQIKRRTTVEPSVPELRPKRVRVREAAAALPERDLIFFNDLGGFTHDGREFVITLHPGRSASRATPAPWSNVLANPHFGTLVTESGGGYTWSENSHEFRLTPFSNDPVSDASGEAFYIRDEDTAEFWSPTPLPARGATPYVTRHGFGYTVFEHTEQGIISEMWVYVAMDFSVKFVVLKLRNISGRPRRLSVTGYWEWVLGEMRSKSAAHVQTEMDAASGAVLARNCYSVDFPEYVAFVDINDSMRTITGDRREFLGRNGTPANPAAMKRTRLSGKTGAGYDPCSALQVSLSLEDREERELTFCLGAGVNLQEAQQLIHRCREPNAARAALERVWAYWNRTLGAVYVDTPDPVVNVLANGWLLYQTLNGRLWGRTGFYQSAGAFGFRDQLQDTMALVHAEPGLLREQLLRAAAHQFREGDVQHWWHPPSGRGVRTHFSDDYLWLPYAACRYVNCCNDAAVLDETVPFLEGRALRPEEESYYDLPGHSEDSATLYEHCVRAIEKGLAFGEHGLPLIGCGDWNDGFNLIGEHGRGESVWLAFFLYDVLMQFSELARTKGDRAFADRCLAQARKLRKNIEANAWDGEWYRRAYFDDGQPLGSNRNAECQIDALPQSWSVLSGAGDPHRLAMAMNAVERRLIRRDAGLVQLFDPPFDTAPLNPGYVKGYVPGVRENGGQYTHAAIWTIMAFAEVGRVELAWELFSMINPIAHGRMPEDIATYKVEPYVVAADIYSKPPHTGRGGWTWYTGSAAWMYRLIIETLLGVRLQNGRLRLVPRLPGTWREFKFHYRYGETFYHLHVVNSKSADAPLRLVLDGQRLEGNAVPLTDDRRDHHVEAVFEEEEVESPQNEDQMPEVTYP